MIKKVCKYLVSKTYFAINRIYNFFLRKGVAGHMRVFIEEPIIKECIESVIDCLDRLYIAYYDDLECVKDIIEIKEKFPNKIVLHKYKRDSSKNFWWFIQKSYKKIHYKWYVKIDADQVYIKENFINNINKSLKTWNQIFTLSGVNVFANNNKMVLLNNNYEDKYGMMLFSFNGNGDTLLLRKPFLSKYMEASTTDGRIIERYYFPAWRNCKQVWGGVNWLHFGPIKIGIRNNIPSKNVSKNIDSFVENNKKNKTKEWITLDYLEDNLLIFIKWFKDNEYFINNTFTKCINQKVCNEHQCSKLVKNFN